METQEPIVWSVYSFGAQAPVEVRSDIARISDSLHILRGNKGVAVRLGDARRKVLFIHHPKHGMRFSVEEDLKQPVTYRWGTTTSVERICEILGLGNGGFW